MPNVEGSDDVSFAVRLRDFLGYDQKVQGLVEMAVSGRNSLTIDVWFDVEHWGSMGVGTSAGNKKY